MAGKGNRKGAVLSQETKDKIRNGNTGTKGNPNGHDFSAEDRIKGAENCNTSKAVHKLVEGSMLDYLREAMTTPDKKGHKFYEDFINAFLKDAKSNTNGQAARMLASGLFNENTLSKLDAQTNRLIQRDIDFHEYRIRTTLYDKQQEVYDDKLSRRIMMVCSRRAGKTELNARLIVRAALTPNTPIAYIHLTFTNGVRQIFDNVMEIAGKCELGILRSSKSDGFIEFANGSSLMIFGNSNNAEADKLRGFKFRLVIIEEVCAQRNLKYLVNDALSAPLKDFSDSQLIMTGTPPRNKAHYSRQIWTMPGVKKYHFTLLDNPFIPNKDTLIEEECKAKGLTPDDPFIRREFMGDMDAIDTETQVYKGYKTYKTFQPGFVPDRVYIGVDFGYQDFNGVVPVLVDSVKKIAYTYSVKKFNKASVTDIANTIIECREAVLKKALELNKAFDVNKIQVITDTNEKSVTFELATTYGLKNVYCAYKYDKNEGISQLAEWLRNGTIYIEEGGELAFEAENTMYKRDDNDNVLGEIDDDLYHPDCMDALLYVSRQIAFDVFRISNTEAKKI